MELCSAIVRHAGNLGMTIHKERLAPAEIVLLRQIHGHDSVIGIIVTHGQARRENVKEVARLRETYGEKLFETIYPGVMPQLPVTLAEAGLVESVEEDLPDEEANPDDLDGPPIAPADATLPAPEAARDRARAAKQQALDAVKALT